jgi:hypothetical protein
MCYIYPYKCLSPTVYSFQYSNFAIAIIIQPIDHPPITIYNVHSPGRPIHAANLLPEHIPKLPAMFMGDLNAHRQWLYGWEVTNTTQFNSTRKHSERIVDWLEQYNFSLHNTPGTYTHFPRQSGASPSIIDLALTSGINPDRILAWNIDKDLIPSDHAVCSLYINLTAGQHQPKRFWAKTNWKIFEETTKESGMDLSALASKTETLRACTNIHSLINKAIDIALPLISPTIKFVAWWIKDLLILRQTL